MTGNKSIDVPFFQDTRLKFGSVGSNASGYPSSQLQKGLILISDGKELVEEGVGFGVPVLKFGVCTLFAGDIELTHAGDTPSLQIAARFKMNLVERLANPGDGSLESRVLYRIKNQLAELYRRYPASRSALTVLSNSLRSLFGWQTIYKPSGVSYIVDITYDIDARTGMIGINVTSSRATNSRISEVILMNEQGAHAFDTYMDTNGLYLRGDEIGGWEEVSASQGTFLSTAHRVSFSCHQVAGATLFRGRELIGTRLAWSGFGYSFPPSGQPFACVLKLESMS